MSANPNSPVLTRSELLQLDDLGDQLDRALTEDPNFDVESFLDRLSNPKMVSYLREEVVRIRRSAESASSKVVSKMSGSDASPSLEEFRPGTVIEEFELTELVGRGATAVVWKARNLKLGRSVSLKFPKEISESIASRLQRESQAVARLQHPNIATIYEIRTYGQRTYLVGEFVDGQSLQDHLESRRLLQNEKIEMLVRVVEAISYSHSMNVVHRDLKPQNILIREPNVPVVVDFGLARVLHSELEVLTFEGDFVGTPAYMAPEQANGHPGVDERVDIYALGVLMFQMLCDQLPFDGTVQSLLHQIVYVSPAVPSSVNRAINRDLDTICLKCLEKNPDDRFQSAQQLALELRRYINGEPIQSRPISSREKMLRWAKKKPVEAALSLLLVASTVVLAIGATTYAIAMQKMRDREHALRISAEKSEAQATKLTEEIEQALSEANRQTAIAVEQARENKSSVELLKGIFRDSEPVMWVLKGDGVSGGEPPTLKQLFENAARRLEKDYDGNSRTKAEFLETLADSCRSTGYLELARRLLGDAKRIRTSPPTKPNDTDQQATQTNAAADLLYNGFLFAQLEHDSGNFETAAQIYEDCLRTASDLSPKPPRVVEIEAEASFHLGRLKLSQQQHDQAKAQFQNSVLRFAELSSEDAFLAKASQIGMQFCDLKPGEVPTSGPLAEFFQQDSWAQRVIETLPRILMARARGDWEQTAEHYRDLLSILRERLPEDNRWHLLALGDYARVQLQVGYYDEAMRAIMIAIGHGNRIAPDHPHLVEAKRTVGAELSRAGLHAKAIVYLEEAVEHFDRNRLAKKKIDMGLWMEIAWCYIQLGQPSKAEPFCRELNASADRWMAVQTSWLRFLESQIYRDIDPAEYSVRLEQAHRLAMSLKKVPNNGIWCHRMATVCREKMDAKSAVRFALAGVQFDQERFFAQHPRVANRRMLFGQVLILDGQVNEARKQFSLALASRTKFLDGDNPLVAETRRVLETLK